jgi:hypothetical protein
MSLRSILIKSSTVLGFPECPLNKIPCFALPDNRSFLHLSFQIIPGDINHEILRSAVQYSKLFTYLNLLGSTIFLATLLSETSTSCSSGKINAIFHVHIYSNLVCVCGITCASAPKSIFAALKFIFPPVIQHVSKLYEVRPLIIILKCIILYIYLSFYGIYT